MSPAHLKFSRLYKVPMASLALADTAHLLFRPSLFYRCYIKGFIKLKSHTQLSPESCRQGDIAQMARWPNCFWPIAPSFDRRSNSIQGGGSI